MSQTEASVCDGNDEGVWACNVYCVCLCVNCVCSVYVYILSVSVFCVYVSALNIKDMKAFPGFGCD